MENDSTRAEQMAYLLGLGYAVIFEAGNRPGLYYCMLRRIDTNQLVNTVVAETPDEALTCAEDWARSDPDAIRPVPAVPAAVMLPERIQALELASAEQHRHIDAITGAIGQASEEAEVWDKNTELVFAGVLERLTVLEQMLAVAPPAVAPPAEPFCGAQLAGGPCVLRPHGDDQPHVAYVLPPAGDHPYLPQRVPGAQHPDPARRPQFHPAEQ
jgi:uncharacterized coiled-coil protein SlyX